MGKKTKQYKNTIPIFRLKPTPKTNECVVQHVGYMTENDKLGDEIIEIETTKDMENVYGKNVYHVGTINGYEICARISKCNIVGGFLVSNDKLPVYNLCFTYDRSIVKGKLFNVYVSFIIDKDCKEKLKKPAAYVGATLTGKYEIEFISDQELLKKKDEFMKSIEDKTLEKYVLKLMSENQEVTELSDETLEVLKNETEEKTKFFNDIFEGTKLQNFLSEKVVTKIFLTPIYKSPHIKDLIEFALLVREENRRREMQIDETFFDPPKKGLNLREVAKNPEMVNKYFGITD